MRGILSNIFNEKNYFIYVYDGEKGLVTNVNPDVARLHRASREQLKSFLKGIIESLDNKS